MPTSPDPVDTLARSIPATPVLTGHAGEQLVIVIDTLVDGVHFAPGAAPADVGFKALAVNLSDLAAMGARPRWAQASVTHPDAGGEPARAWLAACETGQQVLARRFGVTMAPASLLHGSLSISVEAVGTLPAGTALGRAGARAGDRILVTGTLGDAGLALTADTAALAREDREWLGARLARPEPRVEAGMALRELATAAIDVSDGLAADLGHILAASGVGARLTVEALPLSPALRRQLPAERGWELALSAGDDYELCFSVAPDRLHQVQSRLHGLACGVTAIGTVTTGAGLQCVRADGRAFQPQPGYRHFS
jgi:thiamine-monophosphate kinase